MAGVTIHLDDREFRRDLGRLERKLGDLTPFFKAAGELVKTSVDRNFEEGGRPQKWRPVKASTIRGQYTAGNSERKRKRKIKTKSGAFTKGYRKFAAGKKILVDSGDLRRSIHAQAGPTGVMIGTNMVYAAIHHFGGRAGRGGKVTIPARPFLLLQDEDIRGISALLGKMLEGK